MSKEKNKVGAEVVWPVEGTLFSIKDLHQSNPSFVEITLRTKVTKAIENKTISFVGSRNQKKGRPTMIFTVGPLTKDVLNKASDENVQIADSTKALVNVIKVNTPVSIEEPTPEPENTPVVSSVSMATA